MLMCKMLCVEWRCTASAGKMAVMAYTPLVMLSDFLQSSKHVSTRKVFSAVAVLIQQNSFAIGYFLGLIKDN